MQAVRKSSQQQVEELTIMMQLTLGPKSYPLERIEDVSKTVRRALGLKGNFIIELESDLLSGIVVQGGMTAGSFRVRR